MNEPKKLTDQIQELKYHLVSVEDLVTRGEYERADAAMVTVKLKSEALQR